MVLFTIRIEAMISSADATLDEATLEDASDQVELGLRAIVERVAPMFPGIAFKVVS